MDYNQPSNYDCHPSATSTVSPKAKLLDGGDPVVTATTTTTNTTKGPKLKAVPVTNIQINGGRVADHHKGSALGGAAAAVGGGGAGDAESNGMNQPPSNGYRIRESLENVMPSNNMHCTHNLSNNSLRNYSNQVVCHENGTKRDHLHPQQHIVGILKGKNNLQRNGDAGNVDEIDNNYQRIIATEGNSSSNVQVRRIRGRSECTDHVEDDAYYPINGWNGQKAKGDQMGGVAAGLMNGSSTSSSASMFKADTDLNLKRSREDSSVLISEATTTGHGMSSTAANMNNHSSGEDRSRSNGHPQFTNGLFIEDLPANGGDCDKELVSPPAKVVNKIFCGSVGEQDRPAMAKFLDVNDPELIESEYSSLDDEEDDDFNDDKEESGTTASEFLGEDVFDAMTADDGDNGSSNGKVMARQLPKPISGYVLGGSSSTAPFSKSLFPNVPLYFSFATYLEQGPILPPCIAKTMKWKLTPVTPLVVRKVLINTGFRLLKQTNDWMGIWGKHMKSPQFRTIRSYQKYNHIPGSFQIGRKDRVWRNLENLIRRNGKKEFGFMPRTYILPQDLKLLRQMWPKYSQQNVKWIIKPPASARGVGIKVVNRWSQIPKRKPIIVQRYVERPFLIQGNKFDLRLYVLVTSINPLRVYLHNDGLARFASVRYSEKADTLSDRYMHLTNYSINKLSANYAKNEDADSCQGHKWTLRSLWQYLEQQGVNTDRLWGLLRNLIIRTLLAGETPINNLTKANILSKYNCFELFGFDVLLDSDLNPWLLEVNISPSLHSASPLDLRVKAPLVQAVLNTAMYQVPPKMAAEKQQELLEQMGLPPDQMLCHDKRIYTTQLSRVERVKHNKFVNKDLTRDEYLDDILDELTSDDVRCLINTEDELARCAPLERIFPAPNTHTYLDFTESPRYYNRLLDAWETKYSKRRSEAIELLRDQCEKKVHLQVPPQNASTRKDSNNKSIPAKTTGSSASPSSSTTVGAFVRHPDDVYSNSSGPPSESYRESSVESISTTTSTLSECTTNLPMSSISTGTSAPSLSIHSSNSSSSSGRHTSTGTNAIKPNDSFSFSSVTSLSLDTTTTTPIICTEKALKGGIIEEKSPFYNLNHVQPKERRRSSGNKSCDENINTENGL